MRVRKVLSYYEGSRTQLALAMKALGEPAKSPKVIREAFIVGVLAWKAGYRVFRGLNGELQLFRLAGVKEQLEPE